MLMAFDEPGEFLGAFYDVRRRMREFRCERLEIIACQGFDDHSGFGGFGEVVGILHRFVESMPQRLDALLRQTGRRGDRAADRRARTNERHGFLVEICLGEFDAEWNILTRIGREVGSFCVPHCKMML